MSGTTLSSSPTGMPELWWWAHGHAASMMKKTEVGILRAMAQTVVCKVDRPPGPLALGLQKEGCSSRRRILYRVFPAADSTA